MSQHDRRNVLGLAFILVLFVYISSLFINFLALPDFQRVAVGDRLLLKPNFPAHIGERISVSVEGARGLLKLNGINIGQSFDYRLGVPVANQPGQCNLELKLFGRIPLKRMVVDILPRIRLTPGGHSIGVLLRAQGIMVVGLSSILGEDGRKYYPGKEAGLEIGDVILRVNGQTVTSDDQVAYLIDRLGRQGKPVLIALRHKGEGVTRQVKPIFCTDTRRYRIGLYIRDGAAGVGTLTFYDPDTKTYGALGHVINDADTNQRIDVRDGKIVKASVQGIQQGRRGQPGEKIGMFLSEREISGTITKNTRFGIFGHLKWDLLNPIFPQPIPIAVSSQIREGPAQMLTVVNGEEIESFKIEIVRVFPRPRSDGKGMIIRVVDPRLLNLTGGIVQGMSGSPVIQGGKLVGAVTHVFVNDPSRGYGVFIENMLLETDVPGWKSTSTKRNLHAKVPLLFFQQGWGKFEAFPEVFGRTRGLENSGLSSLDQAWNVGRCVQAVCCNLSDFSDCYRRFGNPFLASRQDKIGGRRIANS